MYETTSALNPLQVAHLSCPVNAADPFKVYVDQLLKLGIEPQKEQTLPEKQRLVCEGGMQVFLDAKQGLLSYQGVVDLTHSQNWQSELMRQLQVIMRTLPANKTFSSTVSKIKKGGKR